MCSLQDGSHRRAALALASRWKSQAGRFGDVGKPHVVCGRLCFGGIVRRFVVCDDALCLGFKGAANAVALDACPFLRAASTFFVIFNSLMEWVFLPTTVFLNWHIAARRRPLITGAISLLHEPRLDLCLLYSRNLPADGTAARKSAFCRFGESDCALGKP
jgi:hypothetical protein